MLRIIYLWFLIIHLIFILKNLILKILENKKISELSIEEKEKVLLLIAMLKDSSIILLEPALSLNEEEIDFFKEESKID